MPLHLTIATLSNKPEHDLVVLSTCQGFLSPDGLHMVVTRNIYPVYPQIDSWDVVFPVTLFDSPAFARSDVGPFTVVVRR